MFSKSDAELARLGALYTTREIQQQPELWQETIEFYQDYLEEITKFLEKIKQKSGGKKITVIFTGAGTSQYVGDTLVPYLTKHGDSANFSFRSIATTDIVAAPLEYLVETDRTILVSFARSGNSPESLAAVALANHYVKNIYHLTITCDKEGTLAKNSSTDQNDLLLVLPEMANDKGFAMTGSFSAMTLIALLIFEKRAINQKKEYVATLSAIGKDIIQREQEIQSFVKKTYSRIIYLGSGCLAALTREAQLKVLELTAGKVATVFDSSMGFRHGPKSFVDETTLVFVFVSNQPYTRDYDIDILEELKQDGIAARVIAFSQRGEGNFTGENFQFLLETNDLPDGYLALANVMLAQTIALLSSLKIGNTPDTPSPTGTVNRVVKGVRIHELKN